MTYAQPRAQKGGQTGVNGEWYEGGKFLPSTKRGKKKPTRGTGKQEIAPYQYEVAPDGYGSIYKRISAYINRDGSLNEQAIGFFGEEYTQIAYLNLLYTKGFKWFRVNESGEIVTP